MKKYDELFAEGGRLCYHLTESEETGIRCYGAEIISSICGMEECAVCENISGNMETARRFLNMLAENSVMPWELDELAEYFTEWEYAFPT